LPARSDGVNMVYWIYLEMGFYLRVLVLYLLLGNMFI